MNIRHILSWMLKTRPEPKYGDFTHILMRIKSKLSCIFLLVSFDVYSTSGSHACCCHTLLNNDAESDVLKDKKIWRQLGASRGFTKHKLKGVWDSNWKLIVRVLTSKDQRILREFYCAVVDGMTATWIQGTHTWREDTVDRQKQKAGNAFQNTLVSMV